MSVRDRADRAGNQPGDSALGLNARICRRDFLNSTLLASGRFTELFSSAGFDPRKDIAGIILNRWDTILLPRSLDSCTAKMASPHPARFSERSRSAGLPLLTPTSPDIRVTISPLRKATGL